MSYVWSFDLFFQAEGGIRDIGGTGVQTCALPISGALGLEALSRGAGTVVLVESSPAVLPVLRENVAHVGLPGGRVVAGSVPTVVAGRAPARFDVVLADPPYATPVEEVLGGLGPLVSGEGLAPRAGRGGVPPAAAGGARAGCEVGVPDPPYATPVEEVLGVLGSLVSGEWLAPGAVLVVERSSREAAWEWPTPLTGLRDRRYGEAQL